MSASAKPSVGMIDRAALIRTMARIRAFERTLLVLFSEGKLFGTTHTCIGQEACAAALYAHIDPARDAVFANHRCHGHYLAYGGSAKGLMAEIMGRPGGICLGRGGSQHLCDGRFFSQGVQGGSVPIGAGYAHRLRTRKNGAIVVVHIGDGTLGEGAVYEAMNIVSLLSLPVLVVLEHNGVAQSTATSTTTAGEIETRFRAFGIAVDRRAADDPLELAEHFRSAVDTVRSGRPFVQVLDTMRLMAHSKGDDDRDPKLIEAAWRSDWLTLQVESKDRDALEAVRAAEAEMDQVAAELEAAGHEALTSTSAYKEPQRSLFESSSDLALAAGADATSKRVNELLNEALHRAMATDPDLMVIGEDLLDPYGGAFKVTKGLSSAYRERVFSTPISEAAIVGFGNGYALAGGKAVVEIMFGDFAALAADQIMNQAAKMHFMYGGKVCVPTTIRLVSGGYRGYGPTHSQSLESRFCGVPGLKVVALSRRHKPDALLQAAMLHDPNPVLFVENKLLYALRALGGAPAGFRFEPRAATTSVHYPALAFTSADAGKAADVTIVTYGGLTDMVEEALEQMMLEEELDFDYFILSQLSPLAIDEVIDSVRRTQRLVTVEEGPRLCGIGSEIVSQTVQALKGQMVRASRVGGADVPIPNSRVQERDVLPSKDRIIQAIQEVL